jgi:uncharacterized membrane protein
MENAMRALVLRLVLAVLALAPLAAGATYVFNTIEYPGAVFTDVRGINNTGRIVGYASFDNVTFFSFTYQAGVFSALPPVPGGPGMEAVAHGINDAGDIVGSLVDPALPAIANGFLLPAGSGAYMAFARPGWPATFGRAISNSGLLIGYTDDLAGTSAGFIYDRVASTYQDISIPGSLLTIAQSMNGAGQVVGSAVLPGGSQAWLREPGGSLTMFQILGRPTRARGINDVGVIAGFMSIGAVNTGFVGTSSGFEELMVPGSDHTFPESINNAGQVAGLFMSTVAGASVTKGFIATPASMPTGTTSSGAYTFSVAVVPGTPIFIDPPVAVGYDYSIGKGDPRIATVRLPIGVGDSLYRVKAQGRKFTLAGGDLLDFRTHGFPGGVSDFTVSCIEADAMLDPANPQAFPTELTFMAAGTFTGSMKPLAKKPETVNPKKCLEE